MINLTQENQDYIFVIQMVTITNDIPSKIIQSQTLETTNPLRE
jgi:hypothetical protein